MPLAGRRPGRRRTRRRSQWQSAESRDGRAEPKRSRRILPVLAIIGTAAIVGVTLAAYGAYLGTVGRIHHLDVSGLGKRPQAYNSAENVLVIGAYDDVKDYASHTYQPAADNGADTYLLVHIVPDHKGAVMISFPRDTMVPVYRCAAARPFPGQQAQPGTVEALNQTYSQGGPGCAWKSLEQQTGIRIDHFIEVDYLGFEKFVAAMGGANVCLPYPVDVPRDGLRLPAGRHHIDAAQALQFVRARDIGQWSDLQRIKRQQLFMISVMQSALRMDLLGDPVRLLSVAHTVTPYLTTDSGFSIGAMYGLARSMQGASLSRVQLIEAPVVPYPRNTNRVEWQQPQAPQLFAAVAHDRKLPKRARRTSRSAPRSATPSPGKVHVDVLNGNGVPHAAAAAGSALSSAGFAVTGTGNANGFGYADSVIEYARSADRAAAAAVARVVPGARLRLVPSLSPGQITLVVGAGFHLQSSGRGRASSLGGLAQSYGGVTANQNICQDSGAFSG